MPASALADVVRPLDVTGRIVRSTAAATVCVTTATVAHTCAGGVMSPATLLAVFGGSAAVAGVLSVRRATMGQMIGLLVLCQVGVHLGASSGEMSMSVLMLAGHLAATAVSALVLARGEAYVWRLAERLGLRAIASIRVVTLPFWLPPAAVVAPRSLHDVRLTHLRVERGPPSGCH